MPLSGDANDHPSAWDIRIEFDQPLPHPFVYRVAWAKCDMLATVGFGRLDLFRTERDQYGKRKYLHPKVSAETLNEIRNGVLFALGLGNLTLTGE
ncbi:mRNA interferase MazF [Bradyrhizobium diazoefficiens]